MGFLYHSQEYNYITLRRLDRVANPNVKPVRLRKTNTSCLIHSSQTHMCMHIHIHNAYAWFDFYISYICTYITYIFYVTYTYAVYICYIHVYDTHKVDEYLTQEGNS